MFQDLGWLNLNLGCLTSCIESRQPSSHKNSPNLSQLNPGPWSMSTSSILLFFIASFRPKQGCHILTNFKAAPDQLVCSSKSCLIHHLESVIPLQSSLIRPAILLPPHLIEKRAGKHPFMIMVLHADPMV